LGGCGGSNFSFFSFPRSFSHLVLPSLSHFPSTHFPSLPFDHSVHFPALSFQTFLSFFVAVEFFACGEDSENPEEMTGRTFWNKTEDSPFFVL
jgi:hypothetical protein